MARGAQAALVLVSPDNTAIGDFLKNNLTFRQIAESHEIDRNSLEVVAYAGFRKTTRGKPITTNSILKLMTASHPTVERVLDKLVEDGYLRVEKGKDRRVNYYELTQTGYELYRALEDALTPSDS